MPFTFAHPAVVLPLVQFLGRHGIVSALVIGSVAPDLVYLFPLPLARNESHSIAGLFVFCIPLGLGTYIAFHKFLKGPLLALLPEFLFGKFGRFVKEFKSLPTTNWMSILVCLFLGAVTHLVWDSFTHGDALGVKVFPFLESTAFNIGGYPIYVYKLLQHGSTVFGLTVIAWYVLKWFQRKEEDRLSLPFMLSNTQKTILILAMISIPAVTGIAVGVSRIGISDFLYEFQMFAGHAVFAALPACALVVVLYSFWWHVQRLRGSSS